MVNKKSLEMYCTLSTLMQTDIDIHWEY